MVLNPIKPDLPRDWLEPFEARELKALKDKLRVAGLLKEATEDHRRLRQRYNEFWVFTKSSHVAWRELQARYDAALTAFQSRVWLGEAGKPELPLTDYQRAMAKERAELEAIKRGEAIGPAAGPDSPSSASASSEPTGPPVALEPDVNGEVYLRGLDFRRDVLWVYQTLGAKGVRYQDAPGPGAWSLRQWACEYRTKFFENFLPRAMKGQEDEEGERYRLEEQRVEEVRRVLQSLLDEAAEAAVRSGDLAASASSAAGA